jgi:hypothetical protein
MANQGGLTYYWILPGAGDCNEVQIADHIHGDIDPLHGRVSRLGSHAKLGGQHGQTSMQDMATVSKHHAMRAGTHRYNELYAGQGGSLAPPWGPVEHAMSGHVTSQAGGSTPVTGTSTALLL